MRVTLLDVNVLVALFDPAHLNHEDAHQWFTQYRRGGWATCPLIVNACVRILSNPAYPTVEATPGEVLSRLRNLCSATDHHFWDDSVSLLDEGLFRTRLIASHQKATDIYLLGLAVRHQGRLATFDRSIPLKAVVGAEASHMVLLGASPTVT